VFKSHTKKEPQQMVVLRSNTQNSSSLLCQKTKEPEFFVLLGSAFDTLISQKFPVRTGTLRKSFDIGTGDLATVPPRWLPNPGKGRRVRRPFFLMCANQIGLPTFQIGTLNIEVTSTYQRAHNQRSGHYRISPRSGDRQLLVYCQPFFFGPTNLCHF
jgi:hypothetical protein